MQALHVILLALARDNIQVMMLTAADNAISEGMAPTLLNATSEDCDLEEQLMHLTCTAAATVF